MVHDIDRSKVVTDPISDKTCVVVGTRPGIIKMSPIIAELENRPIESFVIHAGQHYSNGLDKTIFDDLAIEYPTHVLDETKEQEFHGEQTATMLAGIESILLEEQPENVLVCGDANFNLAGGLAARKLRLTLGHVEAGLRSDDWRMPEEHNRVILDHISDYLFAPTETAERNAIEDNIKGEIHITGNTIVDAVQRNIDIAREKSTVLSDFGISDGDYVVFTAHREENVDDPEILSELLTVIERVTDDVGYPVVYPIHPRTEKRLEQFDMLDRARSISDLHFTSPLGYLDFLQLMDSAATVLTDSGGIQEETCILGVPCVTLRENTERPETVEIGANRVAGTDPETVIACLTEAIDTDSDWSNPFGEGTASEQIIDKIV